MRYGVLGPVEMWADGQPVALGPPRQRAVLALLVLHANQVVAVDDMIDMLWGDNPPRSVQKNIQVYVWRLRKLVGDRLQSRSPGYRLVVGPDEVDLARFEQVATGARAAWRAGRLTQAADGYREAVGLWRGDPLADLRRIGLLDNVAALLDQRRLVIVEEQVTVELELGRHAELLPRLEALVAAHPLHERFVEQRMVALHRAGRRAEAYAVYQECQRTLAAELGVEPGPALRRLARTVRADDVELSAEPVAPPGVAPPVMRPAEPARQLPPAVPAFTGRDRDLQAIRDRLVGGGHRGAAAICVVAGSAGVGKSALAIQTAHHIAAEYPDGQLYVNLHGATAGLQPLAPIVVLGRFLRLLGVADDEIPADPDEAAARLRSLTADRRLLMVLDNAADGAQVRPLIPASSGCGVLVTARRPLAELDGAAHVELDILPAPAARALLDRLAGAGRVAAEPAAAAELVHWSGGLPLAVRIIGARLAVRPNWPLGALAARLADERGRLAELRLGDLAVRTSFLVSYQMLRHPLAARLFRLLGTLDGPDATVPVAAALLDRPAASVRPALEELVDARLVDETAPGRYRMHDLIRLFARECADNEEPAEARGRAFARVVEHYLAAARRAGTLLGLADRATALAWWEAERVNLVSTVMQVASSQSGQANAAVSQAGHYAAVSQAGHYAAVSQAGHYAAVSQAGRANAAITDGDHGARAGIALARAMFPFFEARGYVQDWLAVDQLGCDLAARVADPAAEAALLSDLAAGYFYSHRIDEAIACLQRSLPLWRTVADPGGQSRALNLLGILFGESGDLERAIRCLTDSLTLRERAGDIAGQAATLGNIGAVHGLATRFAEAIKCFRSSARLARAAGVPGVEASALGNLGEVYCRTGRYPAALRYLRRSLAVHRSAGNERLRASTLATLAEAYRGISDLDQAVRYAEQAVQAYRAAQFRHGEAVARRRLGLLLRERADRAELVGGDHRRSVEQLRCAEDLFRLLGVEDPAPRASGTAVEPVGRATPSGVRAGERMR